MADWFYVSEGQPTGPLDEAGLREMLNSGSLPRDAQVWQEGMEDWAPACDVAVFSPAVLPGGYVLKPVVPKTWKPTRAVSVAPTVASSPVPMATSQQNPAPVEAPVALEPKASTNGDDAKTPASEARNESEVIFRTPYRFSLPYTIFVVAFTVLWWFVTADFVHSTKILIIDGLPIGHEGGCVFFIGMFVALVLAALACVLQALRGILFPSTLEITRGELRIPHGLKPGSKCIPLSSIHQMTERVRRRRWNGLGGGSITYLRTGSGTHHLVLKRFPRRDDYDTVRQMLLSLARRSR